MGPELLQTRLEQLLASRASPKTICPSEVPRSLSSSELDDLNVSQWRDLMPAVRQLVWQMRDRGEVEILQKGAVLPPDTAIDEVRGPIRVRKIWKLPSVSKQQIKFKNAASPAMQTNRNLTDQSMSQTGAEDLHTVTVSPAQG